MHSDCQNFVICWWLSGDEVAAVGKGRGEPSVTVCLEIVEETQFSVFVCPSVMSISGCCMVKYNEE
jgi:hypothetical protein